ncbi:hypothetical protein LCGC14_0699610, partial [marine sediment metagenome]
NQIQLFGLFSEEKIMYKIYHAENKQIKKIFILAHFLH